MPNLKIVWDDYFNNNNKETYTDRTKQAFTIPFNEIKKQGYDLSLTKYKKAIVIDEIHEEPQDIIQRLQSRQKTSKDLITKINKQINP